MKTITTLLFGLIISSSVFAGYEYKKFRSSVSCPSLVESALKAPVCELVRPTQVTHDECIVYQGESIVTVYWYCDEEG